MGRRLLVVAAAGIVVLALSVWWAVARAGGDPGVSLGGDQGAATTTAAPAATVLVTVASSPDIVPVSPQPASSPVGDLSVTADVIEFGVDMEGIEIARADSRTYVLAYQHEDSNNDIPLLAAFDDAGRELWRTGTDGAGHIAVAAGELWFSNGLTVSRRAPSNGRVVDNIRIGEHFSLLAAFGSLWVQTGTSPQVSKDLWLVDLDLGGWTPVELPDTVVTDGIWSGDVPSADELDTANSMLRKFDGVTAGPDAIWVRLGGGGVAVIDPVTLEVTIIPVDDIGHAVLGVAFDGDVAYVTDGNRVTSIVDGKPLASVSPGPISYLGWIDGVFGVLLSDGRFEALQATEPMVVEHRQISTEHDGDIQQIDGEAWMWMGERFVGESPDLHRLDLLDGRT